MSRSDTDAATWDMIHAERARVADMLEGLRADQWTKASLCGGWSVKLAAAHIMKSGEQTMPDFFIGMVRNGFRFNVMIDRDAHRFGALSEGEIIRRIRARTTTTNRPPAPVLAMLGEVVIHSADIRYALGLFDDTEPASKLACLTMFANSRFPVPSKQAIEGLSLRATDGEWSHGNGPHVTGPMQALLLAMTGRAQAIGSLSGDGVARLAKRIGS